MHFGQEQKEAYPRKATNKTRGSMTMINTDLVVPPQQLEEDVGVFPLTIILTVLHLGSPENHRLGPSGHRHQGSPELTAWYCWNVL